MAQPSQINTLRAEDFQEGLKDKATTDKLFQILNPFLQQVGQTTTAGTSLQSNIDGQFAQADIGKASAWLPMTLTAPFAGNSFGGWPQPEYRVDGTGRLWCRGLFTAASAPTATQIFWEYPKTEYAPTNAGSQTGRLFALPYTTDSALRGYMCRMDAADKALWWGEGQVAGFGGNGETAASALGLNAGVIGNFSVRLDSSGRVHVSGNIGTAGGGIVTGWSPLTIPAAYRPAAAETFGGSIQTAAAVFGGATITVATNGVVNVYWSIGAMQVGGCGVSHLSWQTGANPTCIPTSISYGTLDQISWDTQGGPSATTRPGFPLNIRLKDGKKPVAVLGWATNKDTNEVEVCTAPGWKANGSGPTGNQLTITSMGDLRDDQAYTLNFFIFF